MTPAAYGKLAWMLAAGSWYSVLFPRTTGHFENPDQEWIVDYRVRGRDGVIAQSVSAGITQYSIVRSICSPMRTFSGRFAFGLLYFYVALSRVRVICLKYLQGL